MIADLFINIIYVAIIVFFYKYVENKKDISLKAVIPLVFIAAVIRIFFALQNNYFSFDVNNFMAWGNYALDYGLNQMYRQGIFMDYPPGYMYILYFVTKTVRFLGIQNGDILYVFMLKLPSMIADFGCAYLLYKIAEEKQSKAFAKYLALVFLFMPVVILNSSIWGQVESFYILFVAISIYFAYKNKTVFAGISYAYALLVKPQTLLFGPVLLFYIIRTKSIKEFFKAIISGAVSFYVMSLPFCNGLFDIAWLFELYTNTVGGYKYYTVNAYNLYYTIGLNWVDISQNSIFINIYVITISVILVGFIVLKSKDKSNLFISSTVIITVIFTFCTMMHERYIYPAILFALICFAINKRKEYFVFSMGIACINYCNTNWILNDYKAGFVTTEFAKKSLGFAMIIITLFFTGYVIYKILKDNNIKFKDIKNPVYVMIIITVVYSFFALLNIGSTKAPETFFQSDIDNMSFAIEFEKPTQIDKVYAYSGIGDKTDLTQRNAVCGDFEIFYSSNGEGFQFLCDMNVDDVFTWQEYQASAYATKVIVKAKNIGQVLNEIVFVDENEEIIYGILTDYNEKSEHGARKAVDESHYFENDISYFSSMYFDEIYHARTAYEQLKGYDIYETTHPPLGKILISIGIALFGMNPFGWRIIGVICGIAMLPITYLLVKKLSDNSWCAVAGTALVALDFMHLTQTRIATVDTYVVLFVLLTFLFMAYYYKATFKDKKEWIYLALSGFFMGCAISSKWNGVYPMVALAILFFIAIFAKYNSSQKEDKDKKYLLKTLLMCCIFFVVVPLIIYALSFIPVINASSLKDYITQVIDYQIHMYKYHSQLDAEHYFSSMWYTWPLNIKPMWYAVADMQNGLVSSISAFGNPAIWPLTPITSIYCLYKGIKKKELSYIFVSLGYFSSYLPWVMVTRLSFIYHYFPCAVFGILSIALTIKDIVSAKPQSKKYIIAYIAVCIILFIIFLPITTGLPATREYLNFLEFLPEWHFVN